MNPIVIYSLLLVLADISRATVALAAQERGEIYIAETPLPKGYWEAMNLLKAPTSHQELRKSIDKIFPLEQQEQAYNVVICESNGNTDAVLKTEREDSHGAVQVNLLAHPNVTKEQAHDLQWSLSWMRDQWAANRQSMWSCWTKLYGKK